MKFRGHSQRLKSGSPIILNKPNKRSKSKVESKKRRLIQHGHIRKGDKGIQWTPKSFGGPEVKSEFKQRPKDMYL